MLPYIYLLYPACFPEGFEAVPELSTKIHISKKKGSGRTLA
jgi:hypothetical protein